MPSLNPLPEGAETLTPLAEGAQTLTALPEGVQSLVAVQELVFAAVEMAIATVDRLHVQVTDDELIRARTKSDESVLAVGLVVDLLEA